MLIPKTPGGTFFLKLDDFTNELTKQITEKCEEPLRKYREEADALSKQVEVTTIRYRELQTQYDKLRREFALIKDNLDTQVPGPSGKRPKTEDDQSNVLASMNLGVLVEELQNKFIEVDSE